MYRLTNGAVAFCVHNTQSIIHMFPDGIAYPVTPGHSWHYERGADGWIRIGEFKHPHVGMGLIAQLEAAWQMSREGVNV